MIKTKGIDNGDGTARIDGAEVVSDGTVFEPSEGYVYADGQAVDKTHYMAFEGDIWTLVEKPTLSITNTALDAVVGAEVVVDVGITDVEVFLDGISQGINADTTVEFTAQTAGAFSLRFEKFPYVTAEVVINAS